MRNEEVYVQQLILSGAAILFVMKKNDLLSMLITFVIGLFAGSYLFTTGFANTVNKYTTPDAESVVSFTVVSYVYGNCGDACPSFQITENGAYRLLYTPVAGAEQVLRQGTLSFAVQRELKNALTPSALATQAVRRQPTLCNSFTDGIDIRYEIAVSGKLYELNSCGTAIDVDGRVWQALDSVWDNLENG